MTTKKDGELERCWLNRMENDRGGAIDLHSLSIMQHPRFNECPMTVTQVKLGTGLYTSNLGLFTSEQLHTIKTAITDHLKATGYYED